MALDFDRGDVTAAATLARVSVSFLETSMTAKPYPIRESKLANGRPDIDGDTKRLWEVLHGGGIGIIPTDIGYGICGGSVESTERIIKAKGRGAHKRCGLVTNYRIEQEIHVLDQRSRAIIDCITQDYRLPLGVIAPYDREHPFIRSFDPYYVEVGTALGNISSAIGTGGGLFHDEVAQLSYENMHPIFGSSANLTGTGAKYRLEDIEPEIVQIADIVLDYGLRRLYPYRVASTQINFTTMRVSRYGACYELISDVVKRHFDWDLPKDPGREISPNGHVDEFALAGLKS